MAPMRAKNSVGAVHETGAPNSSLASCGAPRLADLEIGAPGARFMIPMHARSERGLSMNLPSRSAGLWPAGLGAVATRCGSQSRAPTALLRFMVPMHGVKAVGAFHEPRFWNPNDEWRNPKEWPNPNDQTADRTTQSNWTFGLRISFVIRHSSFNDLCKWGSWSPMRSKKSVGALHQPSVARELAGVK